MPQVVNDNHAAIAVLCRDGSHHHYNGDYYDYVIAIFEGDSLGDSIRQFADWKLDDATMNLDGAWRSSSKMRKFAREWYFPPVPRGFDFASVEPQERRKRGFYNTSFSPQEVAKRSSKYYHLWPYEKQFAHFIGVLKFYSQQADKNVDVKGRQLEPPHPYSHDKAWKPSQGFDPLFAYTPYFTDHGVGFCDTYEIIDTAVGMDSVAKLKDRYSGIDCDNITDGLREAYAKGQFSVFNEFGEDEDLGGIRVEAKGMLFTRYHAGFDPDEYGWQMGLRLWPKNDRDCFWEVDFDGEAIIDRMVIESRPVESQKPFAKWWLKYRRRPVKTDERDEDFDWDAFVEDFMSWPKKVNPKSKEWLKAWTPKGTDVPPSGGRDVTKLPNLKSTNPSFAALLLKYIRDRFNNDAPSVYRKAHVSRKTYSSIISNELRPVSKQTAIMFAFALRLSLDEADELLASAGFAFSNFILEDIIIKLCFSSEIYELDRVNEILLAHHAKPLLCQE